MEFEIFVEGEAVVGRNGRLSAALRDLPEGRTLAVRATRLDYVRNRLAGLNTKARAEGLARGKLIASLSADGNAVLVHRMRTEESEREIRILLRATEVKEGFDDGK